MKIDITNNSIRIKRGNEQIKTTIDDIASFTYVTKNGTKYLVIALKYGPKSLIESKVEDVIINGVAFTNFATLDTTLDALMKLKVSSDNIVKTIEVELTRPNDTAAYAAGDIISNSTSTLLKLTNCAKVDNAGVILAGLRVQSSDKVNMLGKRLRFHLYRESGVTPIIDNSPFKLMYINAHKRFGYVDVQLQSSVSTDSDSIAGQVDGINKVVQLVGKDIEFQIEMLDATTASVANSKIWIQAHFIQTN